ncbi:hypothetical protein ABW19_dt0203116 [Dactylella cylindrospora]|nr:hypothetical protein ABW19_dt0203116 [Dactylella cylindrospora]
MSQRPNQKSVVETLPLRFQRNYRPCKTLLPIHKTQARYQGEQAKGKRRGRKRKKEKEPSLVSPNQDQDGKERDLKGIRNEKQSHLRRKIILYHHGCTRLTHNLFLFWW